MDIFDELLAEAKADVKKAKTTGAITPARVFIESDYTAAQVFALFNRVTCGRCNGVHSEFEGLFEERRHRRTTDTHSVKLSVPPYTQSLPRIKKYLDHRVDYCADCSELETYKEQE